MIHLKLSRELHLRVSDYYIKTHKFLIRNEEWESFKHIIPPSLTSEINTCVYKDLLTVHSLFNQYRKISLQIVSKLNHMFLTPFKNLMNAGDESDNFYLIVMGEFEVCVEGLDSIVHSVRTLGPSDYCGEIGLLYGIKRTATIKVLDYSAVGFLGKTDFLDIFQDNKSLGKRLKEKVSLYEDPFKTEIRSRMKKLVYLKGQDDIQIDQLIYSMEEKIFDAKTVIFEENARATQIYFITQGSLGLFIDIQDFDLMKQTDFKLSLIHI